MILTDNKHVVSDEEVRRILNNYERRSVKLKEVQTAKIEAIHNERYQEAASLLDKEKKLEKKLNISLVNHGKFHCETCRNILSNCL